MFLCRESWRQLKDLKAIERDNEKKKNFVKNVLQLLQQNIFANH
jgi:hypothetical protein